MLDTSEGNRYRICYGTAARLFEQTGYDHGYGRDFAARVDVGQIRAEVPASIPRSRPSWWSSPSMTRWQVAGPAGEPCSAPSRLVASSRWLPAELRSQAVRLH